MRPIILIITGLFLLGAQNVWASKIDTVFLQHGDRITGEVKSLASNYVKLSTNDVGIVNVEWNKIDSLKILNNMRIVLDDGQIYYGKLLTSGEVGSCYIWGNIGDPRLTQLSEIVSLSPLQDRIKDRFKGTISSGFSYTKANDIMQFNLNGSVSYLNGKNQYEVSYDGNFTTQDTLDTSERQSGSVIFRRLFPRNWFGVSDLTGETNSEQNLDLRTSLSVGGGNSVVNTNRSQLRLAAALQGSRELSDGDAQNSLEGVAGVKYSLFVYDSPKITFNFTSKASPSLSDLGRIRFDLDSDISWELFSDFYLKWNFYYSYDSRPLSTTASKNDWSVTLLGIEYKL